MAREHREGRPAILSNGKARYYLYLKSEKWKKLRGRALVRDGHQCCVLDCSKNTGLHVHHREYPDRMGTEPLEFLVTLCTYHHLLVHEFAKTMKLGEATDWVLGEIKKKPTEKIKGRARQKKPKVKQAPAPPNRCRCGAVIPTGSPFLKCKCGAFLPRKQPRSKYDQARLRVV